MKNLPDRAPLDLDNVAMEVIEPHSIQQHVRWRRVTTEIHR